MAVSISYLSDAQMADLNGLTVEQARQEFAKTFSIPADAEAMVNGKNVESSYVLNDGDKLEFTSPQVKRF